MKILIAVDDPNSAARYSNTLEELGHSVDICSNGLAAWERFQQNSFHVVISDRTMQGMDGPSLCRAVRSVAGCPYPYFLMITSAEGCEDRLAGAAAGVDDYLSRPIDSDQLAMRLAAGERLLAVRQELRSRTEQLQKLRDDLDNYNAQLHEVTTYHAAASARFQELFDGLPVACFTYDRQGRIHEWNRACESLYGYAPADVFQKSIWETIGRSNDETRARELIGKVFAGSSFSGLERQARHADGRLVHVQYATFPLRSNDGAVVGAISASIDITDRIRLEHQVARQLEEAQELNRKLEAQQERLAELATTDGLTGLRNHRFFRELLDSHFSLARRQNTPLSVVMLDVDLFKQFNDTFGHPAGDDVLRELARALTDTARHEDIIARYGGEEFVVILPMAGADEAAAVAERFRRVIESRDWPLREVTASFGIATMDAVTNSPSDLIDLADKALYQSKANGRNRVTHSSSLDARPELYAA